MVARCAATAFRDRVKTFMPSVTGVAQAGIGFPERLLHLDQAHAAVRRHRQLLVL